MDLRSPLHRYRSNASTTSCTAQDPGTETIEKQENPTAEEGKRKEEEKDGLRMRTLTSKGGSIGPVMVQMAAVSRTTGDLRVKAEAGRRV
ncbi:MAG: hypothetical protein FRX49_13192 [Trebouxia sp. A1-2]|nr:MAG: hypothetical protein FRX49_13192 [Trebouxia sp. A1-2]